MIKNIIRLTAVTAIAIMLSSCHNDFNKDKVVLATHQDSVSYIIGYDYGEGIALKGIETSENALLKGLLDGMTGKSSLPDSLMTQLVVSFQKEIDAREAALKSKMIQANKQEGIAYLDKNKTLDGVVELENGLQYKIVKEGINSVHPLATDSVTIHFRAMFINGKTYDMSYDQGPAGVRLSKMIKGLQQGIQLMTKGSIYDFYVPYYLAYGEDDFANVIPGASVLHYHVELIEINK